MIDFIPYDRRLGIIPRFFSELDPRPAREQINERYAHGGGWNPFEGFTHIGSFQIKYAGDPAYRGISSARLRDELIVVYPHAWVAIFQLDGSFEVARID